MSRRLNVRIRTRSGTDFVEELDADITIDDLKLIIEQRVGIEYYKQRVIFGGSLCGDDASLESLGLTDGDSLWIEGGGSGESQAAPAAISAGSATEPSLPSTGSAIGSAAMPLPQQQQAPVPNMFNMQTTPNMFGMQQNPFGNMFGAPPAANNSQSQQQQPNLFGSPFGFPGFNLNPSPSTSGSSSQQTNPFGQFGGMGQNGQPFDFSQMMQNPMMRSMMENLSNNPEIFRNLFNSNPAFQRILEDNPQLRHMLDDDQLFQTAMRAAQDPDYYNEMLRSNDRALQNIESLPGGFSALSKMYNQIQRPMEDAMDDMYRQRFGRPRTVVSEVDTTSEPTRDQMPNPWAPNGRAPPQRRPSRRERDAAAAAAAAAQRDTPNEPQERPRRTGPDREVVSRVMSDEDQKTAVRNVLSNPESLRAVVDKMLESNPQLRERVSQNPQLREMLTDPHRMAQLVNPMVIEQVQTQNQHNLRSQYEAQLNELEESGFYDEQANLAALAKANGDVDAAMLELAQQLADAEDM